MPATRPRSKAGILGVQSDCRFSRLGVCPAVNSS